MSILYPASLAAMAVIVLPVVVLLRRRRLRVEVPSATIYRMMERGEISAPQRIPWLVLILETAGLAALVTTLAVPVAPSGDMSNRVVVVDNGMSGTSASPGDASVVATVPAAPEGAGTHIGGDMKTALRAASMLWTGGSVDVYTRRPPGADLPGWLNWQMLPGVDERHGVTGIWTQEDRLAAGVLRFTGVGRLKASLLVDGRKTAEREVAAARYVNVVFDGPGSAPRDREVEIRLDPEDGFPADDRAYAVMRRTNAYRPAPGQDDLLVMGLDALGWKVAEDGIFAGEADGVKEEPGIYIVRTGETKARGKTGLDRKLAAGAMGAIGLPEELEGTAVPSGGDWKPLMYAEGKALASADRKGRRLAMGFSPSETGWRDNSNWAVALGIMLEEAGYDAGGLSWRVTGETDDGGGKVLKAGMVKDRRGRIEAYNAFWPDEMAIAAGEGGVAGADETWPAPAPTGRGKRRMDMLTGALAIALLVLAAAARGAVPPGDQ